MTRGLGRTVRMGRCVARRGGSNRSIITSANRLERSQVYPTPNAEANCSSANNPGSSSRTRITSVAF